MKLVNDRTQAETRRTMRFELTHAEVASILTRHLQQQGKLLPNDMALVKQEFDVVEQHDSMERLVLELAFHQPGVITEAERPMYWACLISQKGKPDEIRYAFGAKMHDVEATLRRVYPHLLCWTSTVSPSLPTGVKESEVLEVFP